MSYQIQYKTVGRKKYAKYKPTVRLTRLRAVLLVVATALLFLSFHITRVRYLFLPGDPVVTEQAIGNMVDALRSGESVGDAVTTFCQEILKNGMQE